MCIFFAILNNGGYSLWDGEFVLKTKSIEGEYSQIKRFIVPFLLEKSQSFWKVDFSPKGNRPKFKN